MIIMALYRGVMNTNIEGVYCIRIMNKNLKYMVFEFIYDFFDEI